MNDRNGIEVREGDRVLIFVFLCRNQASLRKRLGYGSVTALDTPWNDSAMVTMPGENIKEKQVWSHEIELPVATAVARSREKGVVK